MKPTALTEDQIQNTLRSAIDDAIAFIESEVAPSRIKAQDYFNGKSGLMEEEGRSKAVATKCRDTVRAVKPALMRVFLQSGKPVEAVPRNPQSAAQAEQATKYAQLIFERNNGFDLLSDAFHDALIKKVGILKAWYDETADVEIDEYTGLDQGTVDFIAADPEVDVLEITIEQETEAVLGEGGAVIQPGVAVYGMKVARETKRGEIKVKSVAPEDFFVDENATSIEDAYICGHTADMRVGDLVEMGFDFEEVFELAGKDSTGAAEEEQYSRTGHGDDDDQEGDDPSMRRIRVAESYMRMDIEGTGIPRLYKFFCAGKSWKVLDYELCDYVPFAVFEVDPEPHTFFGRSLVEIIMQDQDTSTSLLRGMIDGIHLANNPSLIVNDDLVNIDDALNNEYGGIIRARDINAVREFTMGGGAPVALPIIQYYDEVIRAKTGVSGAGMGMDPDALQSQTAAGVNAAVQAASAVSELIARTLAEGGAKQLFRLIINIARANPNPDEVMRINGQYVPVDPRSWTSEIDFIVNVGLGTNQRAEKAAMLQQIVQMQMGVIQSYGLGNGMVTMTGIRNAIADLAALSGLTNPDRYFEPMNPQIEQAIMARQAQASQQGSDPNAAFMQVEQMKTQQRGQSDAAKLQLDWAKAQMADDRERDKMIQDAAIEAAKLQADSGVRLNVAAINAAQRANGGFNGR